MSANASRFARTAHHVKSGGSHSFFRLMDEMPNKAPKSLQDAREANDAPSPLPTPRAIAWTRSGPFVPAFNLVATTYVGRLPGKRKVTHQYWAVKPVARL